MSTHPYRYYYREGMPLRPSPTPRTDAPSWSALRHRLFDRHHTVHDSWEVDGAPAYDTPQTRLLDDHMWQSDELMDAVVRMFERVGHVVGRAMFTQALEQGIESLENPEPELVALFEQLDTEPEWFDRSSAERGRSLWCNATDASHMVARTFALWATSMEDRTSAATGQTRMFERKPIQRGIETAHFFASTGLADTFERFSEGFGAAARVRLVHAQANRGLSKVWGDEHFAVFGPPISSGFLVGGEGWFCLLPVAVDEMLGRAYTEADWVDLAMFWAFVLYVMGAEERIIPKTGDEMRRMADYIFAHAGAPNDYRHRVATTLLTIVEKRVGDKLGHHIGGLVSVVGEDDVAAWLAGTRWEGVDIARERRLFEAHARGEVLTASLIDQLPEAAEIHHARAHDGNPPWMENLRIALANAEAAGIEPAARYASHDQQDAKTASVL